MFKRIHILGASGSGTTTLGTRLAASLCYVHLDTDDYLWKDGGQFTVLRLADERVHLLAHDLERYPKLINSGSLCGWGDSLRSYFDLVIFLYIPHEVRMSRLRARERQRYGNAVLPGGDKHQQSIEFLEWAAKYDHAGIEVRSKVMHEHWLAELTCPVLRLEGDLSVEERAARVIDFVTRGRHPFNRGLIE